MLTKKNITTLSYDILGCAIKVHKNLGPGLLESIYEKCLKYELEKNGYEVKQQIIASIIYDDLYFGTELRLDLLVNDLICIELKTVDEIKPVHQAQLLSYMKILQKPQGLLINFYTDNITKSAIPMVNEYFTALPDL
ncbi:GxxExxY protein [Elizabethkingia ursingii]|uniref:GxxExxY protein n=1 Tax=Elizabethkingia ursingii TaxID=1756150 RepID=UPI0007517587|nr:GxxExxY protein [Elizabethkingia ursingii]KUY26176.1 GxxExxY protein [Elizabethkingia ursingii]MCL1673386.1 GxxExxY protein [Elizabethkingia ursingii]